MCLHWCFVVLFEMSKPFCNWDVTKEVPDRPINNKIRNFPLLSTALTQFSKLFDAFSIEKLRNYPCFYDIFANTFY